MTENDLSVARDIGSLQADMRTVKHDLGNISGKIDALSLQLGKFHTDKARGLGFLAGAGFVVTSCIGVLAAIGKLLGLWGHG